MIDPSGWWRWMHGWSPGWWNWRVVLPSPSSSPAAPLLPSAHSPLAPLWVLQLSFPPPPEILFSYLWPVFNITNFCTLSVIFAYVSLLYLIILNCTAVDFRRFDLLFMFVPDWFKVFFLTKKTNKTKQNTTELKNHPLLLLTELERRGFHYKSFYLLAITNENSLMDF